MLVRFLALLLATAPLLFLHSQEADIRADVTLVRVPALVKDSNGAPISGLQLRDFQLLEDTRPQEIRHLWTTLDEPLTFGLILDLSGSQEGLLESNRERIAQFIDRVWKPGDQGFVAAFGTNNVRLLSPMTRAVDDLKESLDRMEFWRRQPKLSPDEKPGGGGSPVHDALYLAARDMLRRVEGRKVILIVSDGQDTRSRYSLNDTIEMLQTADVPVYAVQTPVGKAHRVIKFTSPLAAALIRNHLRRITNETGGQLYIADRQDMGESFEQLATDLRSTYVLGYYPQSNESNKPRTLQVKVSQAGAKVRARSTYYPDAAHVK